MIRVNDIRDYEVSLWTLQDSFITVLKQYGLDNKERIQDPEMILKDDGENTFSFKIPMYLVDEELSGENSFKENPVWYTARNGNLIANLRKVKVIFNKQTASERVFEFIINTVTEEHSGYSKYCQVQCDGLAFHELGKQGYNITLSLDEYLIECEKITDNNYPIINIDYWVHKVLDNSNWDYEVKMDWSFYPGSGRTTNKVYKDPYVASWNLSNNKVIPNEIITDSTTLEQTAIVESKESNRYNLLMKIAEAFQVFCKFEYQYDENYHIIGRKVIFYNNFINEFEGMIDFTYGYNTSSITRTMDSNDLVSKMYVSSLSDSGVLGGEVHLNDTSINKSMEEYLLNFEYLYKIGTISQEQYDLVKETEDELYKINKEIQVQNEIIFDCVQRIPTLKASLKTTQDLLNQANQRIATARELYDSLEQISSFTITNPYTFTIINSVQTGEKYINLRSDIRDIQGPIRLYKERDSNTQKVNINTEIEDITRFEYDKETGFMTRIYFTLPSSFTGQQVFGVFSYDPQGVSKKIQEIYGVTAENAQIEINALEELLGKEAEDNVEGSGLIGAQKDAEDARDEKLKEKKEVITRFEKIMGPALREGTWQPEDTYSKYQVPKQFTVSDVLNVTGTTDMFFWDNELFEDEQKLTYKSGNDTKYYAAIDLSESTTLRNWILGHENVYFAYRNKDYDANIAATDPRVTKYLALGAEDGCKIAFLRAKNSPNSIIKPVLLITLKTNDTITNNARICTITYNDNTMIETANNTNITTSSYWLNTSNYDIVYPRFQIDYHNFIITAPESKVSQGNTALEETKDYYQLYRNGKFYITIKTDILCKDLSATYKFNYILSTAADAIYLDAVKIMKENSVPKVSYTMEPLAIDQLFMHNAYDRIGQLIHVNDTELKFENVQGYISEVDLNLDKPWEDKYVIKNYKTKFEDLFSTIVAQTEAMQKNSQLLSMMSNAFDANGRLNDGLVQNILNQINLEHVPTPTEIYAQYEPAIRASLKEAFDEAGEVLAAAQSSVADVNNLNIKNAAILGSFVEDIKTNMTPTLFTGTTRTNSKTGQTSENFKVGDIWSITANGVTNEYLATENSSQVIYSSGENKLTNLKGWSLIQDGSLAAIKGASLNIDSKVGKIDLLAENELNIASGGKLKLAGNNVQIIGNKNVEIMGPELYLGSASTASTHTESSGIHILASDTVENGTSAVNITAKGIEMRTANGIQMKAGGGIDISSSDGASTSAIRINKDEGIYLGSNKPLRLYSGSVNSTGSGASVELSTSRILFGVTNGKTGTAVDITKDYMIFGSAIVTNDGTLSTTDVGSKTGAAGVKITNSQIQMAVGNTSTSGARSYLSMTGAGINIANADKEGNGATVSISQTGVVIGTVDKLTQYRNDIMSDATTAHQLMQGYKSSGGATFEVYAPNFIVDSNGQVYVYGAYISGNLKATSGDLYNKTQFLTDEGKISLSHVTGTGNLASLEISNGNIVLSSSNATLGNSNLKIKATGISITSGGTFDVTSNNFIINSSASGNTTVFSVGNTSTSGISYSVNGGLVVKGAITATSLNIGDDTVENWIGKKSYATTDSVNSALANYVSKANLYVNGSSGLIKADAYKVNELDGSYISGTELHMNSDGQLKLSSISGSGNLAQLSFSNGWITLKASGVNNGDAVIGTADLKMGPGKFSIATGSNGVFDVTSSNFNVNSAAGNNEVAFGLGPNNSYLKYTVDTGLEIHGSIYTQSGKIGGWTIQQDFIGFPHEETSNSTNRGDMEVGMSTYGDNTYAAFWAGGVRSTDNTLNPDRTAFIVRKNGTLIAKKAVFTTEDNSFECRADEGFTIKNLTDSAETSYSIENSSTNSFFSMTLFANSLCFYSGKKYTGSTGELSFDREGLKLTSSDITLNSSDLVFRVGGSSLTTYRVIISSSTTPPTDYGLADRILWIRPYGTATESGDNKYQECYVRWISPKSS